LNIARDKKSCNRRYCPNDFPKEFLKEPMPRGIGVFEGVVLLVMVRGIWVAVCVHGIPKNGEHYKYCSNLNS